jgi:periplasmic copper chaperone A
VRGAGALAALLLTGSLAACTGGPSAGADEAPSLRVVDAYVGQADGSGAAAYLTLANDGGADELVAVTTPTAERVELHRTERRGGLDVMAPADALAVPARGELRLEPFGAHLMLLGLDAPLEPGGTVALELSFRRSAPLLVEGPVLSYDDVLARLGDET